MVAVRGSTATSASRRGRLAACAAARPPAGAPGRRDALLGASAAAVATVQLPGLIVPAAAQAAIVSGYTPDDGTTTTVTAFHDTPNAAKVRRAAPPRPQSVPGRGPEGTPASSWRTRFPQQRPSAAD